MFRWVKAQSRAKEARKKTVNKDIKATYKALRKTASYVRVEEITGVYLVSFFSETMVPLMSFPLSEADSVKELLDNVKVPYVFENGSFDIGMNREGFVSIRK